MLQTCRVLHVSEQFLAEDTVSLFQGCFLTWQTRSNFHESGGFMSCVFYILIIRPGFLLAVYWQQLS